MKRIYLKSGLKCNSFDVTIGIKIRFFRVSVTIEPGHSLLQFFITNCLIGSLLKFKNFSVKSKILRRWLNPLIYGIISLYLEFWNGSLSFEKKINSLYLIYTWSQSLQFIYCYQLPFLKFRFILDWITPHLQIVTKNCLEFKRNSTMI